MKNVLNFVKRNSVSIVCSIILVGISVFLSFKSYTPNTFLTGWDTLHPEFNLKHAFESTLWGVWRSDQGLGAIAGHSHMSEIPRLVFLYLTSLVFPLSQLRYLYFFLCLIVGPLGAFWYLKKAIPTKHQLSGTLASFVGASYYLLNLGTLQQFIVPFEMFGTLFAFLPWLFLFGQHYLDTGSRKVLFVFAMLGLLASPSAYAATLWYVFAALFILSNGLYVVFSKRAKVFVKRYLWLILVLLGVNTYWILPNVYSAIFQSTVISKSQINQLFTPEAFLHNKAFGTFTDVVVHKNHLFDWQAYDFQKNEFVQLLESWRSHIENPFIRLIPQVFAVFAFLGGAITVFKKDRKSTAFLLPLVICLFFLMNENGPLGGVYTYLRNNIGLITEGLRMPFTKFSIVFTFFIAYYVAIFFEWFCSVLLSFARLRIIPILLAALAFSFLLVLMRPAFNDGYISPLMRRSIPSEYFQAFKWFEGRPGRIAQLPLNSQWGWQYNKWGYQGAGFFWFGVNNPVLVRDFDRWSAQNETFYKELSRTFFADDLAGFERVLQKYNVKYLVLDDSIFDPGSKTSLSTAPFLLNSHAIEKVVAFENLSIYETSFESQIVSAPTEYAQINADMSYIKNDSVYSQYGTYISDPTAPWKPFVNLTDIQARMKRDNEWVTYTKRINTTDDGILTIPDMVKRESVLPLQLEVKLNTNVLTVRFELLTPRISADGVEVKISPIYMTYPFRTSERPGFISVESFVFDISHFSEGDDFHAVGTVYVNTKGNTTVQVFSPNKIANKVFLPEIKKRDATWCRDPQETAQLGILPTGIQLESGEESLCIGNEVIMETNGLYETTFTTPDGDTSFFCINRPNIDGCINVVPPTAMDIAIGRRTTYKVPMEQGTYWFAFVGQGGLPQKSTATFNDLELGYYPEINKTTIEFGSAFDIFSTEQNIPISNVREVSVSFFASPIISENFALRRGHPNAVNCELSRIGMVTKQIKSDSVSYSAVNGGVSCDYFDYPMLLQTQSYLLSVSGKQIVGRSAKFYLQNRGTSHMDLEELLPNSVYSKNYVIESFEKGQGGYVLNFETRSFGNVPSENEINRITFAPIPTKFLSEITIGPRKELIVQNKVSIINSSSIGLVTKVETTGRGKIITDTAFERGWLAYTPGKGILQHEIANGWANAWTIENDQITYIFYAPQVLQIMGGVILGALLLSFLFKQKHLTN